MYFNNVILFHCRMRVRDNSESHMEAFEIGSTDFYSLRILISFYIIVERYFADKVAGKR